MWTLVVALVWSIFGLALLGFAGFLAARYFRVDRLPDEIHFAPTSDGWRVALFRYRAGSDHGAAGRTSDPVLLVHGVGANHLNFDLTDETSLARRLAARGYDTWVLELRGRGQSTRPRLFSGLRYDWSFDEYAERDLPAAAATVSRVTKRPRLQLVGFSVGALACYAFLGDPHRTVEVGSLVSIGGPSTFKRAGTYLSGRAIRSFRWMRHRFLMRVLAPASGHLHLWPIQVIHNPENMDGATQRRTMVNVTSNFSRNELLQYSDWLVNDVFRSIDQRRDYRAELPRIRVPTLFVAGGRDPLSPPDAVKDAFEAVSSTDKRFVILSRAQKFSVNYGHFDMLLGPHAAREVFPLVYDWLDRHAWRESEGAIRSAATREEAGPAPTVSP